MASTTRVGQHYFTRLTKTQEETFDDGEHKEYENKYGFENTTETEIKYAHEEGNVNGGKYGYSSEIVPHKINPHQGRNLSRKPSIFRLPRIFRIKNKFSIAKENNAARLITKFIKSKLEYNKNRAMDLRREVENSLQGNSREARKGFAQFIFFTHYKPSEFQRKKAYRNGFDTGCRTYINFVFVTLIKGFAYNETEIYDISGFRTLEQAPDGAMMAIEGHKNTFITKQGDIISPKEKSRRIEIAFRLSEIKGSRNFLITKLPLTAEFQRGFMDFGLTRRPPIFTLDSFLFDENNQPINGRTIDFEQFNELIWGLDKIHKAGIYMAGCINNERIAIGYEPVKTDEIPPLLFANFEEVIVFGDHFDLNNSCPGYTHNGLLNVAKGIQSQINSLLKLHYNLVESLKSMKHLNQTSKIHKKDDGHIESLKNEIRVLEKTIDKNRERFILFLEALDNWSLIMTMLKALGVFKAYRIDPKLDEKALSADNPFERAKHYSCEAIKSKFETNKVGVSRKKLFIPESYSADNSVQLAQFNEFMAEAYDESNLVGFIKFIDENVKKKYRENFFQFFTSPVNFLTDCINRRQKIPPLSSMFIGVTSPKRA